MNKPLVTTPHGTFQIRRHDAVMLSAVETKHSVGHYGRTVETGTVIHVEHRKKVTSLARAQLAGAGWGTYLATYDLEGNPVPLQ